MKMKFTPLLLLTLLLLIFQSCHDLELVRIAAVETSRATVFDNSSVELTGAIIDAGEPDDMFGYGFVYSTNPMPTNANQKTEAGTSSAAGAYQSTITNLTPGTWYFRAFVNTSSNGYTYGDVMTFTITQQVADIAGQCRGNSGAWGCGDGDRPSRRHGGSRRQDSDDCRT